MFTSIKTLLFATNLSEDCRPALEAARFFSDQYGAGVVLLHVMDRSVPVQIDEHFKATLGEEKWEAIKQEHEKEAREALIGKMSSGKIVDKVMKDYRNETGIDEGDRNVNWREVVVEERNIDAAIVDQAGKQGCDMIVLGAGKSFWGGNAVGSTVKKVLQKSEIPVLVVPAQPRKGQ